MSIHARFITIVATFVFVFSLSAIPANAGKSWSEMSATEAAELISVSYDESVRLIEEIKKVFRDHSNVTTWCCPIENYSSQVWHELEYRVKEEGNLSLDLEDGYIKVRRLTRFGK